jgi:hypothetical protein
MWRFGFANDTEPDGEKSDASEWNESGRDALVSPSLESNALELKAPVLEALESDALKSDGVESKDEKSDSAEPDGEIGDESKTELEPKSAANP